MTAVERTTAMTPLERAAVWFRDAVIAAALFAAPLMWGRFQTSGLALTFCLMAAGCLAYLTAAVFARREAAVVRTPLCLPLGLFLVIALASTVFVSVNHYQSSLEFYKLLSCAMLFWLIANQPASPWRRRLYLAALIGAAAVTSWLGTREYVIERVLGRNPSYRIFGTFFNPNELAGFLELVIPLAVAGFLWSRSAAPRIITGFAALLTVIALLLTGSRGGWMSFAAGMFVFALLAGAAFRRTRLALLTGAVVIALVLLVGLAVTPLRLRLLGAGERSSNMFRYLTWRGTGTMAAAHPLLGVGPDAFEFAYPRYAVGGFTRMAHQNYLQVTAEMGIPGGLAFVWMLAASFWLAGKGFRRLRDREDRLLCAACIAGVLAFCIHSFLDYGWYIGAIALTVFGLFGLPANALGSPAPPAPAEPAATRKGRRAEPPRVLEEPALLTVRRYGLRLSAAGRWVTLVIAAGIALLAAEHPVRAYLAQNEAQQGRMAENRGNQIVAEQQYRAAVRLAPGSGEYHRQLGRMMGVPAGVKEIQRAIELEPTNSLNYWLLGKMYEIIGPWDEAAANYQRAIELYPNFLAAYRGLANLEARRHHVETALGLYRRMLEIEQSPYERYKALEQRIEPEYAYAHYALGRAALERGDVQAGRAELERALEILHQRETVGAGMLAQMRAAGEFNPGLEQELAGLKARILWRLAQLWARLGDEQKAEPLRVEARQLDPQVEPTVEQEPPLSSRPEPQAAAQPSQGADREQDAADHGARTTEHGGTHAASRSGSG
jgi:putative inorganic carbon (HCO3(-)) transporter